MAFAVVLKMLFIASIYGIFLYLFKTYKKAFNQFEKVNAEYCLKIDQNED